MCLPGGQATTGTLVFWWSGHTLRAAANDQTDQSDPTDRSDQTRRPICALRQRNRTSRVGETHRAY
jgi:hypothetical protein